MAATEALNLDIFRQNPPQFVYLNGAILFVSGLALVRAHPVWERGWVTLITLLGWGVLLLGSYRMIFPAAVSTPDRTLIIGSVTLLGTVGAYLCYKGYARSSTRL